MPLVSSRMRTLRSPIFCYLLWVVAVLHLALAQPQGFISIDCGSHNKSYVDADTNITYISDADLMEIGEIKAPDSDYIVDGMPDYVRTLRAFTKGNRTCYRPAVTAGSKYLLRTSFFYGNYDGSKSSPQFDVYVENAFVETVFTSMTDWQAYELIVKARKSYLTLCLCKTNEHDNPFISAIELRVIPDEIYPVVDATLALRMLERSNFGARNGEFYRYPDDVLDRFWQSPGSDGLVSISTSSDISLETDPYKPPLKVMQIADIDQDNSSGFHWNASIPQNSSLFMCIHFAELQHLGRSETRQFDITVNEGNFSAPIKPSYLKAMNVCSSGIYGPHDVNYVDFTPTAQSNLSSILNAAELYAVVQLSNSATDERDVNCLLDIKKRYGISKAWSGDPCLPRNYAWEGLVCSNDGTSPPRVISLNLSNSGLSGEIPTSLTDLTALGTLNLADNNLTGAIPDFLASLTQLTDLGLAGNKLTGSIPDFLVNLTQLTWIDLSDNDLSGSVPDALFRQTRDGNLVLRIAGNKQLCSSGVCDSPSRKISRAIIIALSVLAALLCFLVGSLVVFIRMKKTKLTQRCAAYTYSQIVQMTGNLKKPIGEGGFGTVFYGRTSKEEVAVKILAHKSKQGSKEFHTEIALLSRVHHRNLVSFLGYCDEGQNMILVYEFLPKGNLREALSGKTQISLDWKQRLQIALDAAQGLEYLHSGSRPAIIHTDVKSTNILLNDELQAKLAGFGLSKSDMLDGVSHISSIVAGTPGYLDPEYSATGWLNEKSDVYSFGIVLLEIISGEQPIIVEQSGRSIHLSQWTRGHILKGNHEKVADPNLHGNYNVPSFWMVADMALECTAQKRIERPSMNTVVIALREAISLCNTASSFQIASDDAQQNSETFISSYNRNLTIVEEIQAIPAPR
ncbi:unnamed protein product [Victoria cruziana]